MRTSLVIPPERLTEATPSIRSKRLATLSSRRSFKDFKSIFSAFTPMVIGMALISILITIGSPAASGRVDFIWSILSRISTAAMSISVPSTNCSSTMDELVEE